MVTGQCNPARRRCTTRHSGRRKLGDESARFGQAQWTVVGATYLTSLRRSAEWAVARIS